MKLVNYLGCIIYKLFAGSSPFKDKSEYLIFKRIKEQEFSFPKVIFNDIIVKTRIFLKTQKT